MAEQAYKKLGRGGAGNFWSKEDIENAEAQSQTDLEAQLQPSPSSTSTSNTLTRTTTTTTSRPPPEYLHTGRGGAGNWTQPSTTAYDSPSIPHSTTTTPTTSLFPISTSTRPLTANNNRSPTSPSFLFPINTSRANSRARSVSPRASPSSPSFPPLSATYRGRGGAGNFLWGSTKEAELQEERRAKREKEEREREEDLRRAIEESVDDVERGGLKRPGRAMVGDRGGRLRV